MDTLAYYTVELGRPQEGWGQLPQLLTRARQATDEIRREGVRVRLVRSIFVPEDETCFYLYEATCADNVREAARRAALPVQRVARTISNATRQKGAH